MNPFFRIKTKEFIGDDIHSFLINIFNFGIPILDVSDERMERL